jgi:hypothetical protein
MDVAHFQSGRLISRFAWAATAWMLPLALSVLMVAPAGAATWNANSGTWSVTSNWGGAALPNGAGTDVRLNGSGGTITVDGSGLTNATRVTEIFETRGEFRAIEAGLRMLKRGDLILVQADQVLEAIGFIEQYIAASSEGGREANGRLPA